MESDIFYFSVPVEATAFLAAVSALAVLLFVIFVYVNKKWRILNVGLNASKPTGRGTQIPVKQHDNSTKRLSPFRPHLGNSFYCIIRLIFILYE